MKNITQLALILILVVTHISCGGNKSKEVSPSATAAAQVKEYKVLALKPRNTTLYTAYPASIQGQQNIEIRPKVDGFMEKIAVDEGALVKKGQQLFKIKAPQFEQEVLTAEASVKSAEAAVSTANLAVIKVRPLVEKDIVSKYELTAAQFSYQASLAALAQARAALANAKTNLGYTTIYSPVDGVIGSIPYRLGSLVNSNTAEPLTTVYSIGNIFAYFAINEKLLLSFNKEAAGKSFAEKLRTLPAVSLILSDGSLYDKKGTIQTVNGVINTETGAANARASFPNQDGLIRSGSSATVRIPNEVKAAIIVPQSATFELQDKRFVVVVGTDNKAKTVAITVLPNETGRFFVVEKGLKAGDKVVLEGVATLKDGSPIKVNEVNANTVYADLK